MEHLKLKLASLVEKQANNFGTAVEMEDVLDDTVQLLIEMIAILEQLDKRINNGN